MSYQPPSQEDLAAQAEEWLKENRPKEYRSLSRLERQEYGQMKAKRVKEVAEGSSGKEQFGESQLWLWAIREVICGLERD